MKRIVALIFLAGACGGNSQPPSHFVIPLPPPPCIGNDTVYAPVLADTARGLSMAEANTLMLPPSGMRGTAQVRMLVDAMGHVEQDSIKIRGQTGPDSLALARTLSRDRFTPARLGACSVRSWFDIKLSR